MKEYLQSIDILVGKAKKKEGIARSINTAPKSCIHYWNTIRENVNNVAEEWLL